ncbi:MAG: hypothetical protein AUH05_02005 [Ktedonobacter sp. 13_2_20CM_53_11]|nr:MAG: hypothetical protein AUH05_02005 [Ktedonobacter sp. 13_2_20CM_53_11]
MPQRQISSENIVSRRSFLKQSLTLPGALLIVACAGPVSNTTSSPQTATTAQATTSTRACSGTPTPSQTEGPFYKPGSPERTSLRESGFAGTPLTVAGYVFSTFRLRGHQYTDKQGRYSLETIVPGEYPGRTRHIHMKVQAPGQSVLTTQLYFPGEPRNDSDGIFSPELLMHVQNTSNGQLATFNFVLALQ